MRYITDIEEFSSLTSIMGSCNWAPEKQRNGISPTVKYTDWSELYREHGFDFILSLAKMGKSEIFYFFTPSHYKLAQYFLTLKRFPMVEFSLEDSAEDIRRTLHGPTPETSLAHCTEFTIFSKSQDWYVYSTHDIELSKIVSYVGLPEWPHDDPYFIPEEDAMKNIRFLFPPQALIKSPINT